MIFITIPPPGPRGLGQIFKKATISKILFSLPTHVEKNINACLWCPLNPLLKLWNSWTLEQGFWPLGPVRLIDVHKPLYLNCETHGPWVRGSDTLVGPIWPYTSNSKTAFYLTKSTAGEDKLNAWLHVWFSWSHLPILWNSWPQVQWFRPLGGAILATY